MYSVSKLTSHRLAIDGEFSDLMIVCPGRYFPTHRIEQDTRTIRLIDDDPEIVAKMIGFMYQLDYNDKSYEEDWMRGSVLGVLLLVEQQSATSEQETGIRPTTEAAGGYDTQNNQETRTLLQALQ
ncbi:hypothetical protein EJ05DRAFT_490524 [Pseudovirgaria hyperparasitica]|uniref:BTB domain-containing protein n=1 Tax=Pseudovirgaria hyperparasitica TaxID=470096 RepID=A0A6A6VTJ4_9PEZI|nr:uncharacterized protein EJ05DRAFT_490524 [Pseudovirgaria hyperparasitica]KAF2752920.1 hypothetical protein EJ05DRAFT_490524 [Pseudovirgaria hyperparasitica]